MSPTDDHQRRKLPQFDVDKYESLYKDFHSNPELSGQEAATAARVADYLRSTNAYTIHEKIGGHGIAAILVNGPGPTVLLRADMDGLPVLEQTSLPYASKATQRDKYGITQPVMHACGHDIHIVSLLAAADHLLSARDSWSGTLVLVFQPAEESGKGAQAMVDDGLYTSVGVPIPDVVLGQHVLAMRAGTVALGHGVVFSAGDSFKITFFGRGGHGSAPQDSIDPVVMAASVVLRLQTIVSREIHPRDEVAVVTVGSIKGGETENVIPAHATMLVNIRTLDEKTRDKVLASMERIVKAEAHASGALKEPTIEQISGFPITRNDLECTDRLMKTFENSFAEDFDPNYRGNMASEDFSILATAVGKPSVYWVIGGVDPDVWDDHVKNGTYIPGNHSPFFAPVPKPTLIVGPQALCAAAMEFLDGTSHHDS
ncbi:Amidohydrolase protein [Rutstroemia sp. NJR-2017a WRK4]|nr:Amidohydrolase protein [Rutstroemia sp. NJR-2017a WRK4]